MRVEAEQRLGQPIGKSERIANHQTAKQIFGQMARAEKNSRGHSIALAPQFKQRSQRQTAQAVYHFLRDGMVYRKEPNSKQTAKEIRRYISDGYGDCKHYATFAVGILNACRIPAWFVLVSQRQGSKTPNHAYAACMIGTDIVVIDPCRPTFNDECKHFHKYNLSPRN